MNCVAEHSAAAASSGYRSRSIWAKQHLPVGMATESCQVNCSTASSSVSDAAGSATNSIARSKHQPAALVHVGRDRSYLARRQRVSRGG